MFGHLNLDEQPKIRMFSFFDAPYCIYDKPQGHIELLCDLPYNTPDA